MCIAPKVPAPPSPSLPTAVFASGHALAETDLLRHPQSARRMEPANMCERWNLPGPSTAREQVLSVVKVTPRNPAPEGCFLRLQMSSDCHLKRSTTVNVRKRHIIKKTGLRACPAPSPSSLLRVASVRLGSPCPWDHSQTGETNCCVVQVDIERHPGPKLAFSSRTIFERQRHPWARRAPRSRSP